MECERLIETISTRGAEIDAFVVPWDSEIFGFPVAQIERLVLTPGEDPAEAMSLLQAWMDRRGVHLASCRLDSRALSESMLLEAHGFRFVEMIYSPVLAPIRPVGESDGDLVIEKAGLEDIEPIETIAGTAFATGRYKLDWRIDAAASDKRYRVWVRNSFADERQQVLRATLCGEIAGFFIVEERDDGSVYWHLTAVAPAFQGRGIGRRLWSAMVRRHAEAGLNSIRTTISAHNAPVMNIYAALGFRSGSPRMTLHWVRE